jgi:hypothetical protein
MTWPQGNDYLSVIALKEGLVPAGAIDTVCAQMTNGNISCAYSARTGIISTLIPPPHSDSITMIGNTCSFGNFLIISSHVSRATHALAA